MVTKQTNNPIFNETTSIQPHPSKSTSEYLIYHKYSNRQGVKSFYLQDHEKQQKKTRERKEEKKKRMRKEQRREERRQNDTQDKENVVVLEWNEMEG